MCGNTFLAAYRVLGPFIVKTTHPVSHVHTLESMPASGSVFPSASVISAMVCLVWLGWIGFLFSGHAGGQR
jgi:hypothetical protein